MWMPPIPVPEEIRKLGKCPNLVAILPGDILLFSPIKSNPKALGIRTSQRLHGFVPEHFGWVHAKLYLGGFACCEAVRPEVRIGLLYERLSTQLMLVRRVPGLTLEQRWKIVENSLWYLNAPYDLETILRYAAGKQKKTIPVEAEWACICSELCARATIRATAAPPLTGPGETVTPALLSESPRFEDVHVGWLRLPK